MKKVLFLMIVFFNSPAFAQNAGSPKYTLYKDHKPVAIARSFREKNHYVIQFMDGRSIIEIHSARIIVNKTPGYVMTFLSDKKQAFFTCDQLSIQFLEKFIIKENLISSNEINNAAEDLYIKNHPLPAGYIDVREFNNIEFE